MRVRAKITAVGVAGVLSALAASASAQAEPGFTADPQSPAGVEYAIPLDTARGQGGGGHHSGGGGAQRPGATAPGGTSAPAGSGGDSPALFGNGITPPAKTHAKQAKPSSGGGGGAQKPARRSTGAAG